MIDSGVSLMCHVVDSLLGELSQCLQLGLAQGAKCFDKYLQSDPTCNRLGLPKLEHLLTTFHSQLNTDSGTVAQTVTRSVAQIPLRIDPRNEDSSPLSA